MSLKKLHLSERKERADKKNGADDPTMSMKAKVKSRDKRDDPTMLLKIKTIWV